MWGPACREGGAIGPWCGLAFGAAAERLPASAPVLPTASAARTSGFTPRRARSLPGTAARAEVAARRAPSCVWRRPAAFGAAAVPAASEAAYTARVAAAAPAPGPVATAEAVQTKFGRRIGWDVFAVGYHRLDGDYSSLLLCATNLTPYMHRVDYTDQHGFAGRTPS